MSYRVLLGVDGGVVSGELTALLEEAGDFDVPEVVLSTADVLPCLDRQPVDVALLHEDLTPLPMVDLLRQVTTEHPEVGVVVAMRDPTAQSVRAVMEAGARAVVAVPVTLEELHTRLLTAAQWAESIRRRLSDGDSEQTGVRSRLVAVAGAKGGVGTTTLAARLALAARQLSGRRVCLVDLDLQTGDVPSVLGVLHQRSIADLIDVGQDITARAVEDSLYVHPTGLRVLLGPAEGELGEDVTGPVAQRVLGALRSMFDVVVVDCGAVATEASTLAVELADDVLLVTTPDIPALRATKRLLRLWSRLEACKSDDVLLVVNRASRDNEVQPRLVGKIVGTQVARTTVPARFRKLEHDINAMPPEKLDKWTLWTPAVRLGQEIGLLPVPRRRWFRAPQWLRRRWLRGWQWLRRRWLRGWSRLRRRGPGAGPEQRGAGAEPRGAGAEQRGAGAEPRGDGPEPPGDPERGSGPMEALSAIFVTGVLFLCLLQAGLAGFTAVMANRAANAGARAYGIGADPVHAAKASLPSGWRNSAKVRTAGTEVTVTLRMPLVFGELSEGYEGFTISASSGTVPEGS